MTLSIKGARRLQGDLSERLPRNFPLGFGVLILQLKL